MGKTVMSYEICLQPWAHSPRNRIRGLTDKYHVYLYPIALKPQTS